MSDTPEKNDLAPATGDETCQPPAVPTETPTAEDAAQGSADAKGPAGDEAAADTPPAPTPPAAAHDMKEAPLLEHLAELRNRLVRCLIAVAVGFAASYAFAEQLLAILLKPLMAVLPKGSMLIATTLPEKFFTIMKLALVAGAFLVSPYIFYQLWKFVAPGLYKEERRLIIPISIATALCFVGGALFGYFVVFPFGFQFFVDYASRLHHRHAHHQRLFLAGGDAAVSPSASSSELPVFIFFPDQPGPGHHQGPAQIPPLGHPAVLHRGRHPHPHPRRREPAAHGRPHVRPL